MADKQGETTAVKANNPTTTPNATTPTPKKKSNRRREQRKKRLLVKLAVLASTSPDVVLSDEQKKALEQMKQRKEKAQKPTNTEVKEVKATPTKKRKRESEGEKKEEANDDKKQKEEPKKKKEEEPKKKKEDETKKKKEEEPKKKKKKKEKKTEGETKKDDGAEEKKKKIKKRKLDDVTEEKDGEVKSKEKKVKKKKKEVEEEEKTVDKAEKPDPLKEQEEREARKKLDEKQKLRRRMISVSNFPYKVTSEMIQKFFEERAGNVESVTMKKFKKTGLSKGTAKVLFMNAEAVKKALLLDRTEYEGRKLFIDKPGKKKKKKTDVPIADRDMTNKTQTRTIHVAGFGDDVVKEDLEQFFAPSGAGPIKEIRMTTTVLGRKKHNIAFVQFYYWDFIEAAIKLHGTRLKGRPEESLIYKKQKERKMFSPKPYEREEAYNQLQGDKRIVIYRRKDCGADFTCGFGGLYMEIEVHAKDSKDGAKPLRKFSITFGASSNMARMSEEIDGSNTSLNRPDLPTHWFGLPSTEDVRKTILALL